MTTSNAGWIRQASLPELVGHWTHEYMHVIGFTHEGKRSTGRPGSVPYAVGLFACQIARSLLAEAYDSTAGDSCVYTMQGL